VLLEPLPDFGGRSFEVWGVSLGHGRSPFE
jgi:hypothetical protein